MIQLRRNLFWTQHISTWRISGEAAGMLRFGHFFCHGARWHLLAPRYLGEQMWKVSLSDLLLNHEHILCKSQKQSSAVNPQSLLSYCPQDQGKNHPVTNQTTNTSRYYGVKIFIKSCTVPNVESWEKPFFPKSPNSNCLFPPLNSDCRYENYCFDHPHWECSIPLVYILSFLESLDYWVDVRYDISFARVTGGSLCCIIITESFCF